MAGGTTGGGGESINPFPIYRGDKEKENIDKKKWKGNGNFNQSDWQTIQSRQAVIVQLLETASLGREEEPGVTGISINK